MRELVLFVVAYLLVMLLTPFVFIYKVIKETNKKNYIETCAIGFDQAGGSVMYSKENFTISSYTYYLCRYCNKKCWFMKFIDFIFGDKHCKNSYFWEVTKDKKDLEEIC